MKLISLLINNFRGVGSMDIQAAGNNVNIYGCNGAGKTSTEDAFLWLLFGKDSADRKDYDLIPHKSGETVPDTGCGREPVVEAKLEYFGKTVTLKKSYIEEWPKRGEMKGQYAGSKVHYFVDDLEVKAGEYAAVVNELIDPELFKLLTNPHYFSETMSWQDRRATLVKITGDLNVSPAPELAAMMGERAFDNFYALSKQNVKATQKQLDSMPYAISEAQRLIPASTPVMPDVAVLEKQRDELENQIQTLKNDDSANAIRREIAEIETKIAEGRNRYTAGINAENEKFQNGITRLETELREKERKRDDSADVRQHIESQIADLTERKTRKLAAWHSANDRVWTGSDTCPTCGQKLPPEQIESAKAKFNKQRSDDLEQLVTEGKAFAKKIEENQAAITEKNTVLETLTTEITTLESRIEKGKSMLKPCAYETQIEYKQLSGRLVDLKNQLAKGTDTEKSGKMDALAAQLSNVKQQIQDADRVKLQIEQAEAQKKHVAELQDQQKKIAADLGNYEKAVALCEDHVKKQARALETAVNGKFKVARFRMFAPQKNHEEAECCDVVYPNGSTNLSTGERLQTGIDIISTLSKYYGVDAPIWIDNAEGITLPVETDAQIIRLIVSERDEKLRIEVADK
jgi:DNA repair exonuclease SbcCD ATPase subunit